MDKIFLVGEMSKATKDIHDFLEKNYSVQLGSSDPQMVSAMLKMTSFDGVVVNIEDSQEGVCEILDELERDYTDKSVILLIKQETTEDFAKYLENPQFTAFNIEDDMGKLTSYIIKCIEEYKEHKNSGVNDIFKSLDNMAKGVAEKNVNSSQKKHILLVDDDARLLRSLRSILRDKYDVSMATSGAEAMVVLGKKTPDLIFLDYEMPVCDGRMTLEMIRNVDETKDIPVVFLTGMSDKEHLAAVFALKPDGYMVKPAPADEIMDMIEKLLHDK